MILFLIPDSGISEFQCFLIFAAQFYKVSEKLLYNTVIKDDGLEESLEANAKLFGLYNHIRLSSILIDFFFLVCASSVSAGNQLVKSTDVKTGMCENVLGMERPGRENQWVK